MKHHEVILELNADPWRLDIDWRYLYEAEKRGIYLSINPDAHEVDGLQNIRFGYYAARKACYPKELIINTKSCEDIADFFRKKK
jgi:DNA polymerase (family 10)